MKEHIALLRGYIQAYASDHGSFPAATVVKKGGGLTAPVLPANPWTGAALHAGSHVGDYIYTRSTDHLAFTLKGRLASASYILKGTLSEPPPTLPNDEVAKVGFTLIQHYIQDRSLQNNDVYPQVAEVSASGAIMSIDDHEVWPFDPWTGFHNQIQQGADPVDFTYATAPDQLSYTLTGHLQNGEDYVLTGTQDSPCTTCD